MHRRSLLLASTTALLTAPSLAGAAKKIARAPRKAITKGRLKQSVSRWCYNKIPLEDLCRAAADMGLSGIDLLEEPDWETPRKFGLVCSMAYADGGTIPDGMNVVANHAKIEKAFAEKIPRAAKAGVPNVIVFFGNRRGMADAQAIDNCVAGLDRVKKIGEDNGVTICIELLNSKVDHKDYQGDHSAFGLEVVKRVNSPRVKLLFDIYHMQIMEGDIVRTIRDHHDFIGHYHTGGVPGRHEIDDTQELNWATVCRAIVESGYQGYVAHEFVPTSKEDPLASLRAAAALCDV